MGDVAVRQCRSDSSVGVIRSAEWAGGPVATVTTQLCSGGPGRWSGVDQCPYVTVGVAVKVGTDMGAVVVCSGTADGSCAGEHYIFVTVNMLLDVFDYCA